MPLYLQILLGYCFLLAEPLAVRCAWLPSLRDGTDAPYERAKFRRRSVKCGVTVEYASGVVNTLSTIGGTGESGSGLAFDLDFEYIDAWRC